MTEEMMEFWVIIHHWADVKEIYALLKGMVSFGVELDPQTAYCDDKGLHIRGTVPESDFDDLMEYIDENIEVAETDWDAMGTKKDHKEDGKGVDRDHAEITQEIQDAVNSFGMEFRHRFSAEFRRHLAEILSHAPETDDGEDEEEESGKMFGVGVYTGEFAPFHRGHAHCIDVASRECDILYVIMFCTVIDEG